VEAALGANNALPWPVRAAKVNKNYLGQEIKEGYLSGSPLFGYTGIMLPYKFKLPGPFIVIPILFLIEFFRAVTANTILGTVP